MASAVVLIFLISSSETRKTVELDLFKMVDDFRMMVGATDAIVISNEMSSPVFKYGNAPTAIWSWEHPSMIVEQLRRLSALDRLEMIAIPDPVNSSLAKMAVDEIRLSRVAVLLPWRESGWPVRLRLDSQFYLYNPNDTDRFDIFEQYSVKSGPVITNFVGQWSTKSGLTIPVKSVWERRSDLGGMAIVAAVLDWKVLMKVLRNEKGEIVGSTGPFAFMLDVLAKEMNFTVELTVPPDGLWGGLEKDGKTWNGIIRMIMDGKADICNAGLTQTLARDAVVDYTIPVAKTKSTLLAPASKGHSTNFWVYMDIFPIIIWLIISGFIIVLGLGLVLLQVLGVNQFHKPKDPEMFSVLNGLAAGALQVLQIGYNLCLESQSAKILFLALSFMSYLIFAYYTCDLTARMTSRPPSVAIRSFHDVIAGEYMVYYQPATANHDELKTSLEGTAMNAYYHSVMDNNDDLTVDSVEEGLEKILLADNRLFFSSESIIRGLGEYTALDIMDAISGHIGFVLAKGSEFTEAFNYHLHKIEKNGLLSKFHKVK